MIPPWIQPCIYWKKSVKWRHHFLLSIFSMKCHFLMGALEAIHMSRTLSGVVAAIHSFSGYTQQMIFDSSYLLRPATFLGDVKSSLFNHSNTSHPSLEVVYLFSLQKELQSSIFEANLPFFLLVSLFVTRCHSLSFVLTRCYSLSLIVPIVVTRCHSLLIICCHLLSFVVPLFVIHCHSLSLDVPLVCLFINNHRILSSIIKKASRMCIFLNHFR